ncbi:hypothetical protein L9F63_018649 [Diploptera punctata]|uniref:Cytochrome b5 heme-binding domain-containing protein n=1 Tax=Diploptera punctata TaxID=6984 RepID=A0AAD8EF03_DIPPU|nr:hypothetical protein L9F63_018649 [Diploptera punctata]
MAPKTEDLPQSSLPGMSKYPTYRREPIKYAELWLEGKRIDDNVEGLWRVHDGLYDFSEWMLRHPGGSDWLTMTKGTDITEAFEAHHVTKSAEYLLKQFYVRPASGPRYSAYTFRDDGFYRTFKRKARPILATIPPGPSKQSKWCADILLGTFLLLATVSAAKYNFVVGFVAGFILNLTVVSAHNFFHMRDNLRMYYFDLSFMAHREWRISHALSHHLYTNSLLDLELALFEPVMQWVPHPTKSFIVRYGSWFFSPIVYTVLFHSHVFIRLMLAVTGRIKYIFRIEDLIPLIPLAVMYTYSGATFINTLIMWLWIVACASFFFALNGFNAAHHHPDVFHDGDTPRDDRDWGLAQIDAARDRVEINNVVFLVLVTFGDHLMHHMFPTVDHWHLHKLYPVFYETCKEFGVTYQIGTIMDLLTGQFKQLARVKPNPNPPGNINHKIN